MNKIKKVFIVLLIFGIFSVFQLSAQAESEENKEVKELNCLMNTTEKTNALKNPDVNANIVFSYKDGDSVMVTGETEDGWYQVSYQGKTGYIQKEKLVTSEIDINALNQEMEEEQVQDKIFIEEVERLRAEMKRSKIWGALIVLLVASIFGLGITSTIKSNRRNKEENSTKKELANNKIPDISIIDINDGIDILDNIHDSKNAVNEPN